MKDQDIEVVELGVASVETKGQPLGDTEIVGQHRASGISDAD